jgi:hypothetical protein
MDEEEDLFAKEGEVTDTDREALVEALKAAYPTPQFLYLRLAHKLSLDVAEDVIALNNPGKIIRSEIVKFAHAQGKVLELLGVTWSDVPGNPKLKALADKYFPNQAGVLAKYAAYVPPPAPVQHASLEKLVDKRSRLFNLATYLKGLARLSGAICTVSVDGEIQGTGFLVGRRSVLTNFHVVKAAIAGDYTGDKIGCSFDFNDAAGPTVEHAGAADWLRSKSPYSQSDLTGQGQPGPDELDYALITLGQEVEPTREALKWPVAPPIVAQRDFLVIGQHPGGDETQIAFGEVVELPQSGLRYRYDVTTEPGSSGSPVLSLDLELVGLHHAGDPAYNPRYNQAVPNARIMAQLKAEQIDLEAL